MGHVQNLHESSDLKKMMLLKNCFFLGRSTEFERLGEKWWPSWLWSWNLLDYHDQLYLILGHCTWCVRSFEILKLWLIDLQNTDTLSTPLSGPPFLLYNKASMTWCIHFQLSWGTWLVSKPYRGCWRVHCLIGPPFVVTMTWGENPCCAFKSGWTRH